jgi:hypothetical protein
MPEGPEVETENLRETIHEELEKEEKGGLIRIIALTTAILAALAALASLRAGATVNEALVLKTEATRLQAEASDQWAYYQAKGIKGQVQLSAAASYDAAGKPEPPAIETSIKKYADEQKEIERAARDKEHERDAASSKADGLLERHRTFANSVAFIQVAIALGAVAALSQNRLVWFGSLALGGVGAVLFTLTALR